MTDLAGTAHPTAYQRSLMARAAAAEAPERDPAAEAFAGLLEGVPDPVALTHAQLQTLLGKVARGIMEKAQQTIDLEVAVTDRMAETLSEMVLSRNGDLIGRSSGKANKAARSLALQVYLKHRRAAGRKPAVSEVAID